MKKALIVPTATLAAAAIAVVLSSCGSAAAAGEQTLSFYEDASKETNRFVDNEPKSPSANPNSPEFRLSVGDEGASRTPVLDSRGGTRIGTAFAYGTVAGGSSFRNAVIPGQIVIDLGDGEIVVSGAVRNGQPTQTFAVTGGTGAYEGDRGSATETEQGYGSLITVHLLP